MERPKSSIYNGNNITSYVFYVEDSELPPDSGQIQNENVNAPQEFETRRSVYNAAHIKNITFSRNESVQPPNGITGGFRERFLPQATYNGSKIYNYIQCPRNPQVQAQTSVSEGRDSRSATFNGNKFVNYFICGYESDFDRARAELDGRDDQAVYNGNTGMTYVIKPYGSDFHVDQLEHVLGRHRVFEAAYDAQSCSGCTQGTRIQLLRDIDAWIKDPDGPKFFWLRGMAGTGKTAIAWTVCSRADKDDDVVLGGSFFCSHDDESWPQRNISRIVPALALRLALQSVLFRQALAEELAQDPHIMDKQVDVQVKRLLCKPLLALKNSAIPILFVIDALDEYSHLSTSNSAPDRFDEYRFVAKLLMALTEELMVFPEIPAKFFVTSRPAAFIRDALVPGEEFTRVLNLHAINKQQVTSDISLYIATRLSEDEAVYSGITGADVDVFARLSDGLFLAASSIISSKFNRGNIEGTLGPADVSNVPSTDLMAGITWRLDKLYHDILTSALRSGFSQTPPDLRRLLASLVSIQMPLSVTALADLLDISRSQLRVSLSPIHAIVDVPDSDDDPNLCLLHPSFKSYLLVRGPSHIGLSESVGHEIMARACLRVLVKYLPCITSQEPDSQSGRELRPEPEAFMLSLEYACLHWISHIATSPISSRVEEKIRRVFYPRLLPWFETMNSMGHSQRAAEALVLAAETVRSAELSNLLRNADLSIKTTQ